MYDFGWQFFLTEIEIFMHFLPFNIAYTAIR